MKTSEKPKINWELVTKGNTQKGVNLAILRFLDENSSPRPSSLLDAPCGQGDFLKSFQVVFPGAHMEGFDLYCDPLPEAAPYFKKTDFKDIFKNLKKSSFDVITNISGVMVVDQLSQYIPQAKEHLNPHGYLILTNDNTITVRDRLSFLFFGRLKRFKLFFSPQEGNWNVVLIQALWKHLKANGFEIRKVQYTSFYVEDFFFLPLALLIYPFMWLHILTGKGEMPIRDRKILFPFSALLARHYIIYAQKMTQ